MKRLRIEVGGTVQGVGFRPYVYGLARGRGLAGFVQNTAAGVVVEVEGEGAPSFVEALAAEAPPLARIEQIAVEERTPRGDEEFVILPSDDEGSSTGISPDVALCGDCLGELDAPGDRRYRYPFINCTNCGPRYSITRRVPYDRPHTTMAAFEMCRLCRKEYEDPENRRFHAEPNACPDCGPAVEYVGPEGSTRTEAAVEAAVSHLSRGGVVAIRGIGGYHLAVDATNAAAVARLRKRKRRSHKAFALMAPSAEVVARYCRVDEAGRKLLESKERPIVLLERRKRCGLPAEVAPGVAELGFMLPYSPLHALLFLPLDGEKRTALSVLVMTSGNLSEEPVIRDRREAEEKLAGIADAYLHHNRDIFMRVDDSVVRVFEGQTVFIRRARGYVPSAVPLARKGPMVLACGADVKNTFCLTTADDAIVSQHIGDMEGHETLRFFEETLKNLSSVYRVEPVAIGHDLHPRYFSTGWALEQEGVEKVGIQHHHAHIASVAAEHGLDEPLVGVALDGSGYGGDGTVWGGEVLMLREGGFERRACFMPLPMPGGEAAARNPWQMLLSWLRVACGSDALSVAEEMGLVKRRGRDEVENIFRILDNRTLSPLTSGAGRLFESVASLLGVRDTNTYEGEAAMALEALAAQEADRPYPFDLKEGPLLKIDFSPTIAAIVGDLRERAERRLVSSRFHRTVAEAAVASAAAICEAEGVDTVALSGGVFQNRILLKAVVAGLRSRGLRPYINTVVPANDAGISLGQAWIVRKRLEQ